MVSFLKKFGVDRNFSVIHYTQHASKGKTGFGLKKVHTQLHFGSLYKNKICMVGALQ